MNLENNIIKLTQEEAALSELPSEFPVSGAAQISEGLIRKAQELRLEAGNLSMRPNFSDKAHSKTLNHQGAILYMMSLALLRLSDFESYSSTGIENLEELLKDSNNL